MAIMLVVSLSSSFGQCPAPEIAPWSQPFTTTVNPPCWTQSTTTGGPWVYTGSPDLGNASTIVDHTSGVSNNYTWVDFSLTDVGVILQSPIIDVTALSTPMLSMWVMSHNNNGSITGGLYNDIIVEASDGLGGWMNVGTISGDFGFQWVEFTYDAAPFIYGANLVQFRFRAESGGSGSDFDNDLLIDDVSVVNGPPAAPPTPTQDVNPPSCSLGSTIDLAGPPPTNDVWYWQTSATGTSTANPYAGPYTIFTNDTYYARTFNSVTGLWSNSSSSIVISNFPTAPLPPAPVAAQDPACVTTGTTISVAAPTAGLEYYWQGTTVDGTSSVDNATVPYAVGTTGTYYVSTYETATQCWSPTVGVLVTVNTAVPAAPTASTTVYNICGGLSDFDITATAPGSVLTTTTAFPSGPLALAIPDNTPAGLTNVIAVSTIPAGATITGLSVTLNIAHTWDGDLDISLMGANGTTIELTTDNGGSGDNYTNTVLSSTGVNPVTGGTAPFTGTFLPEGNLSTLYSLANGNWSLIIGDDASGDTGTLNDWSLSITYAMPADLNWYDAASAGTLLGSGTPFDCIGNSVLADPSSNGSYEFYASTMDDACESATRTLVTVNVSDVNVALTPIDETCIGYMNGSFEISDTLCGTTPFTVDVDGGGFGAIPTDLTAGTYTVTVKDDNGFDSAPMTLVINTTSSVIPTAPIAVDSIVYACTNDPSIEVEAANQYVAGSLTTTIAGGNGCFNGNMFNLTTNSNSINITDVDVNASAATTLNVYYKNGTYVGSETNMGAWTLLGNYPVGSAGIVNVDIDDLNIPAGTTYGMYFDYNANYTDGTNTYSNADVTITTGAGFCAAFSGPIDSRSFNGTINYSSGFPSTPYWYDAAANGNNLGLGTPFQTVGTSLLPTATVGTYEFYAAAELNGCYSVDRALVTVIVSDVNVELTSVDASCNNSATGSFIISNVLCGTAPFTVNVDGAGFGPIPTDLMAGTYSVVVMDDLGGTSAAYNLAVGEADAPSDSYMEDITDNGGQVSWNANGDETEWNVEWGLPGFTPGTGTEIGSTQAMDTFAIITGLDGNTNYDVYISANCGAGTTTGSWDMVNWTTDCGIYTLPFVETFEDNSPTRVCWYNINEVGAGDWTYETGDNYNITTAFEGTKNARFISDIGTADPITKLASPRFDVSGQDSVAVVFSYAQANAFGDQNQTKVYSIGSSSVWTEEAYYTNDVATWTTDTLYVADTTTQIAFEGINNWGAENLIDYVQFFPCTLNSGIDGSSDVCRLDGTFDLNTIITKGEDFGTWTFAQNPGVLNGSIVSVSALPAGTFEFYYIVKTPCATDTTTATLTIFPPSSAGVDGTITACRNEPIYLLSGLTGNVDLGGQWYNPSNSPTDVSITTSNFPGSYNYDYIVSNGVCPNDTSNILVTVGTCDYLDIQELVFGDMNVYPNPTDGLVFISNASSSETFNYELLDVKGQVLSAKMAAINGTTTTEISLEKLEPGVYMIKVYNTEAEKTFRIIKQ